MSDDDTPEGDELRAEMSAADINDLDDDQFAYIEPGGTKDDEGKTVPRSLRHFPINDAAHVRNALARLSQSPFGDKAKAKVLAAAKKFGIEVSDNSEKKSDNATIAKRKRDRQRAVPLSHEVRFWHTDAIEFREQSNTNEIILSGEPVKYNVPYSVRDMFGEFQETMFPGVATKVLEAGTDTRLLVNHSGIALARTVNDRGLAPTMTITDTGTALRFEARLDARQQLANDIGIAVQRGDLSQMSIGFSCSRDSWSDDMCERSVYEFDSLPDLSVVTYAASPSTTVDIAQRMAMMMPLESAARSRKFYVDARAGKKMSASNANMVLEALHTLHEALGEAGASVALPTVSPMDLDGSIGQDGSEGNGETNADVLTPTDGVESTVTPVPPNEDSDVDDSLDVFDHTVLDDGSEGGNILGGAGEGYPGLADGSGLRTAPVTREERDLAQCDDPMYTALVDGGLEDVWVHSSDGSAVVYELFGEDRGLYRLAYSQDDEGVVFDGDAERVMVRSEFVPVVEPAEVVPIVVVRSAGVLRLQLEARKRRRAS